jgi:hypothetical protein
MSGKKIPLTDRVSAVSAPLHKGRRRSRDLAKSGVDTGDKVQDFLAKSFDVLVEMLGFLGLKLTSYEFRRLRSKCIPLWLSWLPTDSDGSNRELLAIKLLKWKASAFYSVFVGNQLPDFPFGKKPDNCHAHLMVGGKVDRWIGTILRKGGDRSWVLAGSILLGWKRGCPRPGKDAVDAAVEKTFKELTDPKNLHSSWADECQNEEDFEEEVKGIKSLSSDQLSKLRMPTDQEVKEEIIRTVKELYSDAPDLDFSDVEPFVPSTSSNYINSREQLGAIGWLHSWIRDSLGAPDLKIAPIVKVPTAEEKVNQFLNRERKYDLDEANEHDSLDRKTYGLGVDKSRLYFQEFFDDVIKRSSTSDNRTPSVKLVGLAEAFKVRIISKGPPSLSTMLKPLQKWLWQTLRKNNVFRLIGEPVSAEFMTETLFRSKLGPFREDDEVFISADYAAATDNLKSAFSDLVADAICDTCPSVAGVREHFKSMLTRHFIEDADGNMADQTKGQLMGSIVSFPVLCILNATNCRIAYEMGVNKGYAPQGKRFLLKDLPLMINGDDAGMRANELTFVSWKYVSKIMGFSPSLGKTYVSTKMIQINSEQFLLDDNCGTFESRNHAGKKCKRALKFRSLPFINMGLLYGKVRSSAQGDEQDAKDVFTGAGSIGTRLWSLTEGLHEIIDVDHLKKRFMSVHEKLLEKCRVPWCIPEPLGGLGLPPIGKFPTFEDVRLGYFVLKEKHSMAKAPQALHDPSEWKMRALALRELDGVCQKNFIAKRFLTEGEGLEVEKVISFFSAMSAITATLPELYSSISQSRGLKQVTENSRILTKLRFSTRYLRSNCLPFVDVCSSLDEPVLKVNREDQDPVFIHLGPDHSRTSWRYLPERRTLAFDLFSFTRAIKEPHFNYPVSL